MDVEIRMEFWASMRDFASQGRTVLFATHYLEEADAVADRIVALARGEIVADGTGAQLKSTVAARTVTSMPRAWTRSRCEQRPAPRAVI